MILAAYHQEKRGTSPRRLSSARLRMVCLVLAALLTVACLNACQRPESSKTAVSAPSTETSGTTLPAPSPTAGTTAAIDDGQNPADNRPQAPSGTLRLWSTRRQSLNPLLDNSETGRAVDRLVYQSLFQIDSSQKLVAQLAERVEWIIDGYLARVVLKSGVFFHDGKELTAADAAYSLAYILDHAGQSQYAQGLQALGQVSVADNKTLLFRLDTADPWLAYRLTFPVVPDQSLENGNAYKLIPGTGPFRMTSYSPAEGLVLERSDSGNAAGADAAADNRLTSIRVIEYNDLAAAMRAFEQDKIDLVSLTSAAYLQYQLRGSLRFEPYANGQLVFIAYNTSRQRPLADPERLLFMKRTLLADSVVKAGQETWGEATNVPLPAASWLLDGAAADVQGILEKLDPAVWSGNPRDLVLLVLKDDSLQPQVAQAIGSCLDRAGIGWRLSALSADAYQAAFQNGYYDLAVMEANMPEQPDPTWLYRDDRPPDFAELAARKGNGLADYDTWRNTLVDLIEAGNIAYIPTGGDLAAALAETAARSPWSPLVICSAALLYGDRIIGQCRPLAGNVYQGIEDLWVWSG